MPKLHRSIAVGLTDKHGGHQLGLCNPETLLPDREGNKIRVNLNEPQIYLWELYIKFIDEIRHFAGKDEIYLFDLGDQTQGNKHPEEVIGNREVDQFLVAESNYLPWLEIKNLKAIRMTKGTSSHVFGQGTSEITIEELLHRRNTGKDIRALYHGLATINDNVTIDYAHHGPNGGSRNWLKGNEARYYLRSLMQDEIDRKKVPPNIVMRGHYHVSVIEYLRKKVNGDIYESWLSVIPSMCLLDDFAQQATKSSYLVTNGMIVYEIINGKINSPIEFTETLDIRTHEDL